jgi:hypothetical protein
MQFSEGLRKLRNTIEKYGILNDDIDHFDETGLQIGIG